MGKQINLNNKAVYILDGYKDDGMSYSDIIRIYLSDPEKMKFKLYNEKFDELTKMIQGDLGSEGLFIALLFRKVVIQTLQYQIPTDDTYTKFRKNLSWDINQFIGHYSEMKKIYGMEYQMPDDTIDKLYPQSADTPPK